MQRHEIPADVKGREKIIGGILDIYQGMWLGGPLLVAAGILLSLYNAIGLGAIILALPVGLIGVPFAFYKKEELTLFEYLKLQYEFKKRKKILIKED